MVNKNKKVILVCKKVKYYSPNDKEAFFEWLHKIKYITEISEAKNTLYLHIPNNKMPDDDLRNIIGLFYRYKINMKQLVTFLNKNNKEWFHDTGRGYWYRRVFN